MTYEKAIHITDQAEADEAFRALVAECQRSVSGISVEGCERIQRDNLAYFAGYYGHATRLRVERLYKCVHPVFGPAINGEPTEEEAYRLGREMGEKLKREGRLPK